MVTQNVPPFEEPAWDEREARRIVGRLSRAISVAEAACLLSRPKLPASLWQGLRARVARAERARSLRGLRHVEQDLARFDHIVGVAIQTAINAELVRDVASASEDDDER